MGHNDKKLVRIVLTNRIWSILRFDRIHLTDLDHRLDPLSLFVVSGRPLQALFGA
jgi:hypothetical protein